MVVSGRLAADPAADDVGHGGRVVLGQGPRRQQLGVDLGFFQRRHAAGAGQFGSGWAWLVRNSHGTLQITKTENGVNPLCFGQTALLGCDVWEHSYYIDFRNKRPAYLTNFLEKLVNWEAVAARL